MQGERKSFFSPYSNAEPSDNSALLSVMPWHLWIVSAYASRTGTCCNTIKMRLMVRVRPGGRVERKKDEREIVGER